MGCFYTIFLCYTENLSSSLFLKQQEVFGFPGKVAKRSAAPQRLLRVEPSEEKHPLPGQRWASQGTASVHPQLQGSCSHTTAPSQPSTGLSNTVSIYMC